MTKTGFIPYESDTNNHVKIIKNIIQNEGYEIYNPFDKSCPNLKIINLNWFESIYGTNYISILLKYLKKKVLIQLWKIKKIKLVYTIHNKLPHDIKYSNLIKKFIIFLCKKSDAIIVMSKISFEYIKNDLKNPQALNKTYYIPLPNYIDTTTPEDYKSYTEAHSSFNLLFFGVIKPYKNIELLINVFNDLSNMDINLLICGKPITKEYGYSLESLIKNKKIKTKFEFISEKDLDELIKKTDCCILPYDKKSSLNSGAAIHAFSLGKTVISPAIGTILDMPEDSVFSYDYTDETNHYKNLKNTILKAYDIFSSDKNTFNQKSLKAYNFIKENNSHKRIGLLYNEVYKAVLNEKDSCY